MPENPHNETVTIKVNGQPVVLPDRKVTGQQIKGAAIAQGVAINPTSALFRITGQAQHPVRDDDEITVHDGQEFRAVDADDNS